jgi:hypothetical protein
MRPGELGFIAVLACTVTCPSYAQELFTLSRLSGPIQLDGFSSDAAWQEVAPVPAGPYEDTSDGMATERTVFRVAYDEEYLYAAGEMHDSNPQGIRPGSLKRDASGLAHDWFAIMVDGFNDKENFLFFGTNPAGVRTDGVMRAGQQVTFSTDWNTYWDSAVQRTDEGWFAEIRIPLSSLRFQERGGQVTMGLTVWRYIARKDESVLFPTMSIAQDGRFRASYARTVVLEDVQRANPVYLTPYVLAGSGRSHALNGAETEYASSGHAVREAGLDLKYALTSNLTLDVTYNTDFAQAEADDQQVNLTRFSIFFPEKRLFFQERAEVFEFSTGQNDRLFYSRRIGLVGNEQVPIHGGTRLVGRVGGWDVGALTMQTASFSQLPSENFAVVRSRRQVINENSYIGGIFTSRVSGGRRELLYGLDGTFRVRREDYLNLNWAQSFGNAAAVDAILDRSLARGRWERRGSDGFTYGFEASRSGEDFHPAMGYQLRRNFTRFGDEVAYGWRPGPTSVLRRVQVALNGYAYRDNSTGRLQSAQLGPEWVVETKSGRRITIGAIATREEIDTEFRLSPSARVPAGSYSFKAATFAYRAPNGAVLRPRIELEAGSFFDGSQITGRIEAAWNSSPHLELGGSYQLSRISFPSRDQRFRPQVVGLRANVMLNTRLSSAAFLQYSSASDRVSGNIRFRFNPREGDDLYVVYNLGLNTDRFEYSPIRPMLDHHVLMIKYSRTFDFGS